MAKTRRPSMNSEQRRETLWIFEREHYAAGGQYAAGVDEAGRGPLAGPVVVAAVILPAEYWRPGLNDSKQVTPSVRDSLYDDLRADALAWSIQVVPVATIDEINILEATRLGMRNALCALSPTPDLALIDGWALPACPVPQRNVIDGDTLSASIAAASILAKVHRDRLMLELDAQYPGYGFAQHKGYSTPEHLDALHRLGPCAVHRRSFAPVRACEQCALPIEL
ncbi:MAG: ribonuclease HII [Armatimonadota bacterium]